MRPIALALLVLLSPAAVWGQESKPITVDGVSGVWFPAATAKRMLEDLTRCQGQAKTVELLEQRLVLEKERTELLQRSLATTEKIATVWKETAEQQAKQLVSKDPWWKNQYLWSSIGFVLGAGVTVGVTSVVQTTK